MGDKSPKSVKRQATQKQAKKGQKQQKTAGAKKS